MSRECGSSAEATTATGVPTHLTWAAWRRLCRTVSASARETFEPGSLSFPYGRAINTDVRRSRRVARILAANPRAAIYGTIVASAVIATTAGGRESAALILEATLATLLVFWLAHVYADFLGHALRRASSEPKAHGLRHGPGAVHAGCSALSIFFLLLGALGVLGEAPRGRPWRSGAAWSSWSGGASTQDANVDKRGRRPCSLAWSTAPSAW